MSGLLSSRWATANPQHPSQHNPPLRRPRSENKIRSAATSPPNYNRSNGNPLPPSEELSRFMKIVARLRWKLPFLAEGYRLATLSISETISAADIAQAEIMFKIDFHEYYALLERAIVHLLAVFNISVSSRGRGVQVNSGYGSGSGSGSATHRFHANVLEALQDESTPLTPVLGTGYVHELLRKAKELRNRWKCADMTDEEREKDPFENGKKVLPLASFNFDEILMGIFGGLEEAYVRAKAHVDLCRRPGEAERVDSESDWGFMVDAMDWEAV